MSRTESVALEIQHLFIDNVHPEWLPRDYDKFNLNRLNEWRSKLRRLNEEHNARIQKHQPWVRPYANALQRVELPTQVEHAYTQPGTPGAKQWLDVWCVDWHLRCELRGANEPGRPVWEIQLKRPPGVADVRFVQTLNAVTCAMQAAAWVGPAAQTSRTASCSSKAAKASESAA